MKTKTYTKDLRTQKDLYTTTKVGTEKQASSMATARLGHTNYLKNLMK